MKKQIWILFLFFFAMCACNKAPEEKGTGYLTLNISQSTTLKSDVEITDFILRIHNGYTDVILERIGDLPEQITLSEGTYTIEAYSMDFSEPKFEMPFYSGKTTVVIEAGETKEASIVCSQGNAGIKVVWSGDFSRLYSTYYAQISNDAGYLHYSSEETRTGYFLPGTVSVSIMADGLNINGGTIMLAARDMVTASLRPKETQQGSLIIAISIDETVNERAVEIIVDPEYQDSYLNSETNPYSVAQAIEKQGEEEVWVTGYIVGSKPSANYDFVDGTWLNTNIVIADDINETDSYKVIFVELTNAAQRNAIGLVGSTSQDYSDRLHRRVMIQGNLRGYQSRNGLRDLTVNYLLSD